MPIEEAVVVMEDRLVLVARFEQWVALVVELPEHVMKPVRRDVADHEVVPRLRTQHPPPDLEPTLRHLEHLVERYVVTGLPEVRDVEDVLPLAAELLLDLDLELLRIRPPLRRRRRQETPDTPPRELLRRRERRRHADQHRTLTSRAERVPYSGS